MITKQDKRIWYCLAIAALAFSLFGCIAQNTEEPKPPYSENASTEANDSFNNYTDVNESEEVILTLIKFHGNSQCVSCTNLGKFANTTLHEYFQNELREGKVQYLDINAETDIQNPYVQKYHPTHASLYLLTKRSAGEDFEELAQAWYYTNDEEQYHAYLAGLLRTKLGE